MDSGKPRQNKNLLPCLVATVVTLLLAGLSGAPGLAAAQGCLSPQSLVATRDGKTLFIGCATTNLVLEMDVAGRTVTDSVRVPGPVSGLALSPDERVLVVTCPGPPGRVCRVVLDATGRTIQRLSSEGQAGHTAGPVAVGLDGKHLFVCHRFEVSISDINLGTGQEVRRMDVRREPVAVAEAGDGKYLSVASLQHAGRADGEVEGAVVSVVDLVRGTVEEEIQLPSGSGGGASCLH